MQLARMGVVGWVLVVKGALFLFGARHVVEELLAVHPVTFGFATRGEKGMRRFTANLRVAGVLIASAGGLLVWLFG